MALNWRWATRISTISAASTRMLINNGAAMIGKLVRVYTTDNKMVTYQIDRVRRHVSSIQNSLAITTERLWLQTSEGPKGTPTVLQVVALPLSVAPADPAAAHPTPHPLVCT